MLADLLNEAGVQTGAEQVFSTSLDGWTCGFPVAVALDGRDAMIALGMNGEPLAARARLPGPAGRSRPVRLRQRDQVAEQDRIDHVGRSRRILGAAWLGSRRSDQDAVAHRRAPRRREGRRRSDQDRRNRLGATPRHREVEVRIDDGQWQQARLGNDVTDDAWRQWVLDWDAKPGKYTIQVRATDKDGNTQTADISPARSRRRHRLPHPHRQGCLSSSAKPFRVDIVSTLCTGLAAQRRADVVLSRTQ